MSAAPISAAARYDLRSTCGLGKRKSLKAHFLNRESMESPADSVSHNKSRFRKIQAFVSEHKMALIALTIILIWQAMLLAKHNYIPGPIYGGDLFRERGFTQSLLNGNSIWQDPYFKEELAFRQPLPYVLAAVLTKITGASLDTVLIFFPLLISLFSGWFFYLLSRRVFKSNMISVIGLLLFFGIIFIFDGGKHTKGLGFVFLVWLTYCLVNLYYKRNLKQKVLTGTVFGLVALSHLETLLHAIVFVVTTALVVFWEEKRSGLKNGAIQTVKLFFLPGIIALLLSLIHFGPLITTYHLAFKNPVNQYAMSDINLEGVDWWLSLIFSVFWNTGSARAFIFSVLVSLGTIIALLNIKLPEIKLILAWLFGIFLATGHHLITRPLFNFWITPGHIFGVFIPTILLATLGTKMIIMIAQKKGLNTIAVIVLLLFGSWFVYGASNDYQQSRWVQYGMQQDAVRDELFKMSRWVLKNTPQDAVFLANDESAFALNALTGRFVVASRRVHASQYVDVEQRYADAVVMLYGKNDSVRRRLFDKYGVRYLYVDQFLYNYPIIVSPYYKNYLIENGVSFSEQNARWDPSTDKARELPSLIVPPQELQLINHTVLKQQFSTQQGVIAAIYEIDRK